MDHVIWTVPFARLVPCRAVQKVYSRIHGQCCRRNALQVPGPVGSFDRPFVCLDVLVYAPRDLIPSSSTVWTQQAIANRTQLVLTVDLTDVAEVSPCVPILHDSNI